MAMKTTQPLGETAQAGLETKTEDAAIAIDQATQGTAAEAQEVAFSLALQAQDFFIGLLRPWNAYQVAITLGILVAAYLLARILAPKLRAWMRERTGWPKWRFRILLAVQRRLWLIFFVILLWMTIWVMREVTWPSRSYLLGIIGTLTFSWLIIATVTRQISNRFMRQMVRYAGWTWVTLSILGLMDETRTLLDSAAFDLGATHFSLWLLVQALFILGVLFFIARLASRALSAGIKRNPDISPSMQVLAIKFLQVGLYAGAFFIGLRVIGLDLTGLAVLSGAIGLGIGFGLQKVVSNLISGVIILLDKSIKPGDVISLGGLDGTFGWIDSLGARYVSVVTRDGQEWLIPNEDLITGQVVNWSHSNELVRLDVHFGTAYGDNPHKVRATAIEAALSVERVLATPRRPVCHITGFGDSSVDYILRFWIKDPTGGLTNIRGNVFLALWDAFQKHGISIPFPQREIKVLEGSQLDTGQKTARMTSQKLQSKAPE